MSVIRIVLIGLAVAGPAQHAAAQQTPPVTAQPAAVAPAAAPETQAAFHAFANAADPAARFAGLTLLKDQAASEPHRFVQQAALFARDADGQRAPLAVGALFAQFQIAPRERVRALAPLLDRGDPALAAAAAGMLAEVEQRSAGRRPDFSYYRELLAEEIAAGRTPPRGLVEHMYAVEPGEALLVLMRAHEWRDPAALREILWAEHVVAELYWKRQHGFIAPDAVEPAAVEQLDRLAQHEAWWARMYVAAIVSRSPELGSVATRDRLLADPHEWVRAAVGR